jgi:hypothetical protein
VNDPQDDRPPLARGIEIAYRIIGISLQMVLPGVLGLWVDRWLGTRFVFTLLGFGLGLYVGIRQLVAVANSIGRKSR